MKKYKLYVCSGSKYFSDYESMLTVARSLLDLGVGTDLSVEDIPEEDGN